MLVSIYIALLILYIIFIGWLSYGFDKVEDFELQDIDPKTTFSIVIPFRNESKNLPQLLTSLTELNYPKSLFEIILIDDDSNDNSVKIIRKAQSALNHMHLIKRKRISASPKKDAITTAIGIAKYDWIITTDADCYVPKYWLDSFDEYIQTHKSIAVVGPVEFSGPASFFSRFQILDTLSLQGVTIGAFGINRPFICNGANFSYSKESFVHVKGFFENNNIASGDDIFLLERFWKLNPKSVHYLKSEKAIVRTKVATSVSEYIHQRLRWASKSRYYKSLFSKLLGAVVFLSNLTLVTLIPLALLEVMNAKTVILLFLLKFSIDLLLLFKTAQFFKSETMLFSYALASIIYPFITVYIVLTMPFKHFQWKGRYFKS